MIRLLVLSAGLAVTAHAAVAQDQTEQALRERASALLVQAFPNDCGISIDSGQSDPDDAEVYTFTYMSPYDGGVEETVTLLRFFCSSGAYNLQHVYFVQEDGYDLRPLHFAAPDFETVFDGEGDEAPLLELNVTGMATQSTLTNSEVDVERGMITSHAHWRGIGDASSAGTWVMRNGQFVLQTYLIDPTYDGEINPVTAIDHSEQ